MQETVDAGRFIDGQLHAMQAHLRAVTRDMVAPLFEARSDLAELGGWLPRTTRRNGFVATD